MGNYSWGSAGNDRGARLLIQSTMGFADKNAA